MSQFLAAFIVSPEKPVNEFPYIQKLINTAGHVVNITYPAGENANVCIVLYEDEESVINALRYDGFILENDFTLYVERINRFRLRENISIVGNKVTSSISSFYSNNIETTGIPEKVGSVAKTTGTKILDFGKFVGNKISETIGSNQNEEEEEPQQHQEEEQQQQQQQQQNDPTNCPPPLIE
eukprot:TRINITY_DN2969_c2_g2_i6.p1 TRINITY_DN2969_c2_g2~~TRINITY_DN2969_c2_g2_i6.p1  ORF type:complete len:181 (+),score=60.93 TRINITY_DN2969_c2_g2_i6:39-581(+)